LAYLLDSNILLRLCSPSDPDNAIIRTALRKLRGQGEQRCFAPQNLVEYWSVCTRPITARGGYGLTTEKAHQNARILERLFVLLPDNETVHTEWRRLVIAHGVLGVQVHDARIVAAMYVHGITHILTLNPSDFARYPNIAAVHPNAVF